MGVIIKHLFTVNGEEGRGYKIPKIVYVQLARPQTIFLLAKTSLKRLTKQDLMHTFKNKNPFLQHFRYITVEGQIDVSFEGTNAQLLETILVGARMP